MLKFEYHRIGRLADVAVEVHSDDGTVYVAGVLRFTPQGLDDFLNLIHGKDAQAMGVTTLYCGEIPSDAVALAMAEPEDGGQA